MFCVDPIRDLAYVVNQAAAGRSLTTEEAALVRAYVEQHCDGMSTEEIVQALCMPTVVENPDPAPRLPRSFWEPDKLNDLLLQAPNGGTPFFLALDALASEGTEDAGIARLTQITLFSAQLKAVNLENPMVAAAMGRLLQLGVMTQETYDAVTTEADPMWPLTVVQPSPLEQLGLGQGAVITAPELEALLG